MSEESKRKFTDLNMTKEEMDRFSERKNQESEFFFPKLCKRLNKLPRILEKFT